MQASALISDRLSFKGRLRIERIRNGTAQLCVDIANLYTNAGRAAMANALIGAGSEPTHIAIGTGTTAAALGDTALETEVYRDAVLGSRVTTLVANDTARFISESSILAGHNITEAGLLNAAVAGDLFCRQVFAAVVVISGDVVRVTWDLYS